MLNGNLGQPCKYHAGESVETGGLELHQAHVMEVCKNMSSSPQCMYVFIVCMYLYIYISMCLYIYTYIYISLCVCACVCVFVSLSLVEVSNSKSNSPTCLQFIYTEQYHTNGARHPPNSQPSTEFKKAVYESTGVGDIRHLQRDT